jgi:hypothetical protein
MTQRTGSGKDTDNKQVIDFTEVRAQKLEEKRRKTERIFFKHLLSVYSVVGEASMFPIELIDVSEEGCSFQIPHDPSKPWPHQTTDDLPTRLYFSQDTFLEIRLKILNSRACIENGTRYVRFGCSVDPSTKSFAAYQQFVKFLKLYSEQAHKDMGDITVFYL